LEFFYIQYAVVGGPKGFNGVKSVIVQALGSYEAEQFVRQKFEETGRKVLIMVCMIATVEQVGSNRIPIYK